MKIKIIFMLAIVCFAAVTQAQDTWIDDWKELQNASARTIARYNPSALCKVDWISAPGWTPSLSYDVCIVAGFHFPNVLWLVISVNDTSVIGRRFVIIWQKDGETYASVPIQHYQVNEAHVEKIGSVEQVLTDFDTIKIWDIDSFISLEFAGIELELTGSVCESLKVANKHRTYLCNS